MCASSPAAETIVYFGVAELITNATKHADATRVDVELVQRSEALHVTVRDDGRGGALVVGLEPHPPLAQLAAQRTRGMSVTVVGGEGGCGPAAAMVPSGRCPNGPMPRTALRR